MNATRPITILAATLALALGLLAGCATDERDVTTASEAAYQSYQDGQAATERFRLEKARESYQAAVGHDPGFAMAWAHLALVQRQLGDTEEAMKSLERGWELRAGATEIEALWIDRAHAIFQRDSDRADAIWEEMLEKYPEHEWVLRLRAEIAKQDNDFDTAMRCYDMLLDRNPDAVAIHNLKGYLYLSRGEYDQAVLSLQRYAYYAPDQANPHDSLGEAFLYIGRYEESIREFRTALEIDPAFHWSARNLAETLSITGQVHAAVKVLENYKPLFEERKILPWWDLTRTMIALRAEQWDEVLTLSDGSLERLAGMGEKEKLEYELFARYARTVALLETGRLDAAEEASTELERVAQGIKESGPSAGMARPKQVMEINESLVLSRFDRAAGVPTDGIPRLEKAIDSSDLSPHELAYPVRELALAYLEAGQPVAAAAAAQRVLGAIPTSPELNLVAAKAEAAQGNRDAALGYLQTYLDVMRNADAGHRRVAEATALVQQLTPRS